MLALRFPRHAPLNALFRPCSKVLRVHCPFRRPYAKQDSAVSPGTCNDESAQEACAPPVEEAVEILNEFQQDLLKHIRSLRAEPVQSDDVKKSIAKLKLAALALSPEERRSYYSNKGDPTAPMQRLFWKTQFEIGVLRTLIQKCEKFHIFEDLFPLDVWKNIIGQESTSLRAEVEMQFADRPERLVTGYFIHELSPEVTAEKPELRIQVVDKKPKLYTLALVDVDYPSNPTMTNHLNWLITNLPISVAEGGSPLKIPFENEVLPYVPPHPQRGTDVHRIALVLFQQFTTLHIERPKTRTLNVYHDLIKPHALIPRGIAFFTTRWSSWVTDFYKKTWGVDEPHFAKLKQEKDVDMNKAPRDFLKNA